MAVSREFLRRAAIDTGFQIAALEKVVRLGELAGDIAKHPLLGEALALKGGTPLNLCFGEPKRMSVDLDYNYIHHLDRAAMLAERPNIEKALHDLAKARGYKPSVSVESHAGRTISLQYRSVEGPSDLIKLDVNYAMRLPLGAVRELEIWQPGALDRPVVTVVSSSELLVGKTLAFFARAAARDAWDLANLPRSLVRTLGTQGFRPMFLAMSGMLIHQPAPSSLGRIRKIISAKVVSEQLLPMLVAGQDADAANLVDRAWGRVASLVELTRDEALYFEGIRTGELRVYLLFPSDPATGARIAQHPSLLWKIQNVQKHKKKR